MDGYDFRKSSNKCHCDVKNILGVKVEYRVVNQKLEESNEINGDFIRNLVYKPYNKLLGGWSAKSKVIYD